MRPLENTREGVLRYEMMDLSSFVESSLCSGL